MSINCDPSELAKAASCFGNCIPAGLQPAVQTYLLCQLAQLSESIQQWSQERGYTLYYGANTTNVGLLAGTTTYIGFDITAASNSDYEEVKIRIPTDGTLAGYCVHVRIGTPGSNEPITHYMRINGTTNVGTQVASYDSSSVEIYDCSVNAPVSQHDFVALGVDFPPMWASAPAQVRWVGYIFIR